MLAEEHCHDGMKTDYCKAQYEQCNDRGNVQRPEQRGNDPPERAQVRFNKLAQQLADEIFAQVWQPGHENVYYNHVIVNLK